MRRGVSCRSGVLSAHPSKTRSVAQVGTKWSITPPGDFVLARDVCSYGYFLLAPNRWDVKTQAFSRVLDVADGPVTVRVTQRTDEPRARTRGNPLNVEADRTLSKAERAEVTAALSRMLRLDEDEAHVRAFHQLDPRWKKSGRARLFRSASFFEDVIKTVTSCNVTWPSTVIMNRRLCEVVGRGGAFPTIQRLAKTRPQTLRARCSVGYRDERIIELARMFAKGELAAEWFEDPARSDEEIRERLLELPGIGPYAAANILQLLGRYAHLPLDTESVRHGKAVLAMKGSSAAIMKRISKHFEPFGAQRFRSYWFEIWAFYESKRGPSETWEQETTGKTFTAAALK